MKRGKRSYSGSVQEKDSGAGAGAPAIVKRMAPRREPEAPWAERHFRQVLIGLCLAGLLIRCIILAGYNGTPLALHPINDARVYWEWAGDIAAGKLVLDHPFFSAPLYPYLLAGARWLGAQPSFVYALQMLGDLAAVALLGWICRQRFGAKVAVLAMVLYLLLLEPASAMLRVLASSLHLLLVVAAWAALVRVQERQSWRRLLAAGAALGLLSVAYAPAILLLPVVAVWLFVIGGRKFASAGKALIPALAAAVIIAPATIHNWYAGGGFFPVQGGGGITLLQGNSPSSTGSYTVIPGVSAARELMHADTEKVYREATGREPNWVDVDRYFRNQALELWRSQPAKLLELLARKFYLFVSSRHYADIYQPTGEMAEGVNLRLRLAPLPLAWLIGPALVGLVLMLRKPAYHAPECMLFAIPFLVVLTFFYSPRYRVPAIPIIVIAAAWTFAQAWRWRLHWPVLAAVVPALALGIVLEPVNQHFNVDRPSRTTTLYNLAYGLRLEHRLDEAINALRKGLAISPQDGAERVMLGEALAEAGRHEEAVAEFSRALGVKPADATVSIKLAASLFALNRVAEADQALSAAVQREPDNAVLLALLAGAKLRQGQRDAACGYFEKALQAAPDNVNILADYGNALISVQRWEGARVQFEKILAVDPNNFLAGYRMGVIAGHFREYGEAQRRFERARSMRPNDAEIVYDMGYLELIQGHLQEAARLMHQALELNPNYGPAQDRLRELEPG